MSDPYALLRGPLRQAIVARRAAGQSLKTICAEPGMPCRDTVHHWTLAYPAFAEGGAEERVDRSSPPRSERERVGRGL